jgi:hypothetical protein
MLLVTTGGICVIIGVLIVAFPEVWEAARQFDWSQMADALKRQFGY